MVNVTSLEKYYFYLSLEMQKKSLESNKTLLNFVSSKYRQSVKVSLEVGKLVVTKVDETLLHKFKTEKKNDDYLAALEFQEKEECNLVKDDYTKFS